MTNNNHPITPPPKLVEQWCEAIDNSSTSWKQELAVQAARWGADMELVACMDYVDNNVSGNRARAMRAARRPKPPSLKEQAFEALHQIDGWAVSNIKHLSIHDELVAGVDTIRRALEALPD